MNTLDPNVVFNEQRVVDLFYLRCLANEVQVSETFLKATFDAPLYPAGSLVSLRSSAPWRVKESSPQGIFMVVQTDAAPVVSACKGAKVYKIMPVGSPTSFIIEERHIKKIKKV